METDKITIIGAGNLGVSIAKGLVGKEGYKPADISLTKRDLSSLGEMCDLGFDVTPDNMRAVINSSYVLLCVQPGQVVELKEVLSTLHSGQVLVSVATGVSIKQLKELCDRNVPVVRAMPNTAIAVGESMTCLAADKHDVDHLSAVAALFDRMGETLVVREDLMQAATVLGASGIAFFMRYLRAATQGGVQMGFDSADAQLIAMQTAKGAAMLVLDEKSHPEIEIDKVTTPQGCTIEGLNEMEHQGFSSALIQGIMTSYYRITKMKKD